jgi:CheY-like chemotaxis protein
MEKAKILLIDDEGIFLMAHKEELEAAGYTVSTALSGSKGLQLIKEEHFRIAFIDLVMPGMNGVEACREIKIISPETEVVLVSGYPYELHKHLLDFLGAGGRDEHLTKPLFKDELVIVAGRILNKGSQ